MDNIPGAPDGTTEYENTASVQWAQQALAFYEQGLLQLEAFNNEGVISAQVWGTCPRCGHDLDVQLTLSAPVADFGQGRDFLGHLLGAVGRAAKPGIPPSIEVGCGCGKEHPGAPADVTGCGVSFRLPAAAQARRE